MGRLYQLKGLGLWLLDLLITFNPPPSSCQGSGRQHRSRRPEGGDGFVFLALFCSFASPVMSPWKQVQPLCCFCFGQIDAYWGFFFAVYPPSPIWHQRERWGPLGDGQEAFGGLERPGRGVGSHCESSSLGLPRRGAWPGLPFGVATCVS